VKPAGFVAGALTGAGLVHALPALTAWRQARVRLLPTLSGAGRADHVALTFDDGPDPVATPRLLDLLDALNWKASFFLLGDMVRRDRALAQEVADRGHEIAVHGFRHVSHLRRRPADIRDDVIAARDLIEDATGQPVRWLRPPYGAVSAGSLSAARAAELQLILWTTWGRDWRGAASPATVEADVQRTMEAGATVLLHDSDCTSALGSWRSTLGALPALAERWASEGRHVGPLRDHGLTLRL
jgi:peptidoglycan/xylan/chitin deacetylase (PgdA/CDA1 family)